MSRNHAGRRHTFPRRLGHKVDVTHKRHEFSKRIDRDYLRALCIVSHRFSDNDCMISWYTIRCIAEFNLQRYEVGKPGCNPRHPTGYSRTFWSGYGQHSTIGLFDADIYICPSNRSNTTRTSKRPSRAPRLGSTQWSASCTCSSSSWL